ncbi:MAG: ribosome assembly RNA-binding protein YhbY [Oleiphilus sp.]|nr:MAG: ribosome assembly RNA-binding protein YhbY [Oleiphilus sp.]
MTLTAAQKKQYRAIAHNLNPIIIVGDKGLTEPLMEELDRALNDHELIKIKIAAGDRDDRAKLIEEISDKSDAELVQSIGKVAVILRKNKKPNPKLSNLLRR